MKWIVWMGCLLLLALVSCRTTRDVSTDQQAETSSLKVETLAIKTITDMTQRATLHDITDLRFDFVVEEFNPETGALMRRTTQSRHCNRTLQQTEQTDLALVDSLTAQHLEDSLAITHNSSEEHVVRKPPDRLVNVGLLALGAVILLLYFVRRK